MAGQDTSLFSHFGFQVTLGKWTILSFYSCKKGGVVVYFNISIFPLLSVTKKFEKHVEIVFSL